MMGDLPDVKSSGCARFVEVWGPCFWKSMHTVAATAPGGSDIPESYFIFFELLGEILPCAKCRSHYGSYLQQNPVRDFVKTATNHRTKQDIHSYGNIALQRWVNNVHNDVNKRTNRPEITFEQSLGFVHNKCMSDITPENLATPFIGGHRNLLTTKQHERITGTGSSEYATASYFSSTIISGCLLSVLVVACLVINLKPISRFFVKKKNISIMLNRDATINNSATAAQR